MKYTTALMIFLLCAMTGMAQVGDDENAIPDQYIVHLLGNVDGSKFFTTYKDVQVLKCLAPRMNIWLVKSEDHNLLQTLLSDPAVKVAQHDHGNVKLRSIIPNDSLFNLQWNLLNTAHPGADISATEAWQMNHSNLSGAGDSIVIAVVDAGPGLGFDIYHPDINFFVNHQEIPYNGIDDDSNGYVDDYHGWNVFTQSDSVLDLTLGDGHPTHVSGIAGAIGDNTIGIAGVSWGTKVLAIVGASNTESDVVASYAYALEMRKLYDQTNGRKGAFIVATNSSFGIGNGGANPASYPIWCSMYDSLGAYGILSATAAPDADVNVDAIGDVPTGCPSHWMISVTNTTQSDGLYQQAAFGPSTIDIGAPGISIMSCVPVDAYEYDFGTSMSSPHIAGAVAAMIANACPQLLADYKLYPDSIALILKNYMYQSVDPLNDLTGSTVTGGRLNLYHAFIAENSYNCNNCNFSDSLSTQNLSCDSDGSGSIMIYAGTNNSLYHYLWSTGDTTDSLTHLQAGWYQVTVTDTSGCQRQLYAYVHQPQPISVTSVTTNGISGGAGNIIVLASAGNDTLYFALDTGSYQQGSGGGTTGVLGSQTFTFTTGTPGLHIIYIANQYGCVIEDTVGIYDSGETIINSINSMSLSPNPSSGTADLTINSSSDFDAELSIYDLTGRILSKEDLHITNGSQHRQMDLSALADGSYIMDLSKDSHTLFSTKAIVINH